MTSTTGTLREEYRMRFSETEAYRAEVWKILCRVYFQTLIDPASYVLDLGAGWGEFINHISAQKKYALDLNPEMEVKLDVDVIPLSQDSAKRWKLRSQSLDVIFSSNFLEHLPDKACVERTLSEAYRCLKPGGKIICMGPNVKFLPGSYWDFWDHYVPLTEDSLSEVLRMTGFSIERKIARFLPYSMSTGRTPPLRFVEWYLHLPFAWSYFGKQFLVVATKR